MLDLQWLGTEHLIHKEMVDKDLTVETVELLQLDILWKDHQYILVDNYKLDCGFWLDILHLCHKFLDKDQHIFDCCKPHFEDTPSW
jgi:hypothetical protein